MAPEIVEGLDTPSIASDLHSLAVLLFYLLLFGHPLEGLKESNIKILDAAAQKYLYGSESVYIFDNKNPTNRPDPSIHKSTIIMSYILPNFLMTTFNNAFTLGLHDPSRRVPDSKWCIDLKKLIDSVCHCPSCGQENFAINDDESDISCWKCKKSFTPLKLRLGNNSMLISSGLQVARDGEPLGIVVRHPKDPKVLGLTNKTSTTWRATLASGQISSIPSQKSIVLGTGLTIDIGQGLTIMT